MRAVGLRRAQKDRFRDRYARIQSILKFEKESDRNYVLSSEQVTVAMQPNGQKPDNNRGCLY